jgi:hypothetical protein
MNGSLIIIITFLRYLSISSHITSFAPLTMILAALSFLKPLKKMKSLSPIASS